MGLEETAKTTILWNRMSQWSGLSVLFGVKAFLHFLWTNFYYMCIESHLKAFTIIWNQNDRIKKRLKISHNLTFTYLQTSFLASFSTYIKNDLLVLYDFDIIVWMFKSVLSTTDNGRRSNPLFNHPCIHPVLRRIYCQNLTKFFFLLYSM